MATKKIAPKKVAKAAKSVAKPVKKQFQQSHNQRLNLHLLKQPNQLLSL
jgi:hypothetical protein